MARMQGKLRVRVSDETIKQLEEVADEQERSVSSLVRAIVKNALEGVGAQPSMGDIERAAQLAMWQQMDAAQSARNYRLMVENSHRAKTPGVG